VLQIAIISRDVIAAMDVIGNLKILTISNKMFMDRVIKTVVTGVDLVVEEKVKKMDMIRNLVRNFPFIKEKEKDKG
jgi:hypothetical protein